MMPSAGSPALGIGGAKASALGPLEPPSSRARRSRLAEPQAQRARLIASTQTLALEVGTGELTVERICEHAGISRRTFYKIFIDVGDGVATAVEEAHERLWTEIDRHVQVVPRAARALTVSTAIAAFLAVVEAHPAMGWLCVVEPANGLPRARAARQTLMSRLAGLIVDGCAAEGRQVDGTLERAALGSVGALWELAFQHLAEGEAYGRIQELAGPAILVVLSPYVGRAEAMRLAARPPSLSSAQSGSPAGEQLAHRLTELARRTLLFLLEEPLSSNSEIAASIGVTYASQMSRHLRWLEEERLVVGRREGRRNAWLLTERGEETVRAFGG